jgi:hypothetical protein
VVPDHRDVHAPDDVEAGLGVGAIAATIAEHHVGALLLLDVFQHHLEGIQIGMNVGL